MPTPGGSDFEIEPGVWFGEWLHDEIAAAVHLEKRDFFAEQVARIADRLQVDRDPARRMVVEIPWISLFTAFTTPGRYIYFSRRLLERCPDDHAVAFVIAHEIAHHDLGHLDFFRGPFARHLARFSPGQILVLFFRALNRRIYNPERELEADRRAIELLVRAGYDGYKSLRLFHILKQHALDVGDLDMAYGPDAQSDRDLAPDADWLTRTKIWVWQRSRGYLPIQDREAEARRHLESIAAPTITLA